MPVAPESVPGCLGHPLVVTSVSQEHPASGLQVEPLPRQVGPEGAGGHIWERISVDPVEVGTGSDPQFVEIIGGLTVQPKPAQDPLPGRRLGTRIVRVSVRSRAET